MACGVFIGIRFLVVSTVDTKFQGEHYKSNQGRQNSFQVAFVGKQWIPSGRKISCIHVLTADFFGFDFILSRLVFRSNFKDPILKTRATWRFVSLIDTYALRFLPLCNQSHVWRGSIDRIQVPSQLHSLQDLVQLANPRGQNESSGILPSLCNQWHTDEYSEKSVDSAVLVILMRWIVLISLTTFMIQTSWQSKWTAVCVRSKGNSCTRQPALSDFLEVVIVDVHVKVALGHACCSLERHRAWRRRV